MQTNIPNILFCSIFILLSPVLLQAQDIGNKEAKGTKIPRDSVATVNDSISLSEATQVQDSIKNDSIKRNQLLTDLVTYKAKDYMRLSQKEHKMYLYNEAEISYEDMDIKAGLIVIDNEKSEVYAYGIPDSTGAYSQAPVFTQAQKTVEPDSIRFNFKTRKALVFNSRTQESQFYVKGAVTKRENDSVYFMKNVRFT
ncbi:MAG: LPS-assembly protein LptD, partial [Salegentibacter sp.]